MSRHDPLVTMRQMRDHAREAVELTRGLTRAALDRDRLLQLALTHLITIVGEAARRVPPEAQAQHPQVPWRLAQSMRDRILPGYDTVDLDVVWDTATSNLPPLVEELERILTSAER